MLQKQVLDVVRNISGVHDVTLDSKFIDIGMDSTGIIELLVEFEIIFNTDILEHDLMLDDFIIIRDIYHYLNQILKVEDPEQS